MRLIRRFHLALLCAGSALFLVCSVIGCGGHSQIDTPDPKALESHKLHPPVPSAVPHGMNK